MPPGHCRWRLIFRVLPQKLGGHNLSGVHIATVLGKRGERFGRWKPSFPARAIGNVGKSPAAAGKAGQPASGAATGVTRQGTTHRLA
jgi:hypothetical protein